MREGDITFFCHNFSVPQFRKNTLVTVRFFRKTVPENVFYQCEGGSTFSRQIFSVSLSRKFSLGNLRCFKKIPGSEKNCMEEGGRYHVFPAHFFCSTLSKLSIGNTSLFQNTSNSEYTLWMQGGISRFHVELF